MLNTLEGLPVFEDMNALETTNEPVKKHILTKSQFKHLEKHMFKGITYHDRIQKKWIKRWGYKQKPAIFKTQYGWFIHPYLMVQLKNIGGMDV